MDVHADRYNTVMNFGSTTPQTALQAFPQKDERKKDESRKMKAERCKGLLSPTGRPAMHTIPHLLTLLGDF